MQKTVNYNLNVPELTDAPPDITKLGANFPLIDAILKDHEDLFGSYVPLASVKSKGDATTPIYFDENGVAQPTDGLGDYLPLSGGTMSGTIVFSGGNYTIRRNNNSGNIAIIGGSSADAAYGAKCYFYGADSSTNGGCFLLQAGDSGGYKQLLGKPDGTLTWGGKNIVRIDASSYSGATGYIKLHDNLVFAWSVVTIASANTSTRVNKPISFTTLRALVTQAKASDGSESGVLTWNVNKTNVAYDYFSSTQANDAISVFWVGKVV